MADLPLPAARRLALGLLAAGLAAAPTALGANVQSSDQARCTARNPGIAVGDSVLEDVAAYQRSRLKRILGGPKAIVDGKINRQFSDGTYLVKGYLASRRPCAVVIVLGTNGPVRPSQWSEMMTAVKTVPRVVVVNTYTRDYRDTQYWMPQMNADIAKLPKTARNARVADWYRVATTRSGILEPDGVHPSPGGSRVFVQTIQQSLNAK